jgi:hypothetical protein
MRAEAISTVRLASSGLSPGRGVRLSWPSGRPMSDLGSLWEDGSRARGPGLQAQCQAQCDGRNALALGPPAVPGQKTPGWWGVPQTKLAASLFDIPVFPMSGGLAGDFDSWVGFWRLSVRFVEGEREPLGAIAAGPCDMPAQLADESFRAGHVRFGNSVGAIVQVLMRSDVPTAEAFFRDHLAVRLFCMRRRY